MRFAAAGLAAAAVVVVSKGYHEIRQHRWRQLQGGWGAYDAAAAAAGWSL